MKQTTTRWLRPLAIGLLAWNLLGAYACLLQIRLGMGAGSLPDPYEQALYSHLPSTYGVLFAAAEFTGLVGAALLCILRPSARIWFVASLIFIVLQFGYLFATTDLFRHEGLRSALFPLFVTVMAALQIWASLHLRGERVSAAVTASA